MHANKVEAYGPGYSAPVLTFMRQRTAETHAGFFLPRLKPGWRLLDAGCGPGTITLGLGRHVAPGSVAAVDIEDSQFEASSRQAHAEGLKIEFQKASVMELPFPDSSFDAVFSHALFEHVPDARAALAEMRRVLKPGGLIGIRAGDLGGMLVDSASEAPAQALKAYIAAQNNSSKDSNVGRKLGRLLRETGFAVETMSASYEVISDQIQEIGPLMASQFVTQNSCSLAERDEDTSLFVALAWCEAIGRAG